LRVKGNFPTPTGFAFLGGAIIQDGRDQERSIRPMQAGKGARVGEIVQDSKPLPTLAASVRDGGSRRISVVHFLIALVVLLVAMPFVDELANGDLIEATLMT